MADPDPLLLIALDLFGKRGFDGVGTREIATAAGKPMSAITYHFGGKQGLYLDCARYIADRIAQLLSGIGLDAPVADRKAVREQLELIVTALITAMLRVETAQFARFIMREQQEPTEAFDIIYGGVMGQVLARIARLVEIYSEGSLSPVDAKVRAFTLMGQIIVFRVGHAAALRFNGWDEIGAEQLAVISRAVVANLHAILDHLERRAAS